MSLIRRRRFVRNHPPEHEHGPMCAIRIPRAKIFPAWKIFPVTGDTTLSQGYWLGREPCLQGREFEDRRSTAELLHQPRLFTPTLRSRPGASGAMVSFPLEIPRWIPRRESLTPGPMAYHLGDDAPAIFKLEGGGNSGRVLSGVKIRKWAPRPTDPRLNSGECSREREGIISARRYAWLPVSMKNQAVATH